MPYLELSLRCTEAEQPRYENALEDVGALSVTLLDADADTGSMQWEYLLVTAHRAR